jgi:hypothetical protein
MYVEGTFFSRNEIFLESLEISVEHVVLAGASACRRPTA